MPGSGSDGVFAPLIAGIPAGSAGVHWLVQPERGPRLVLVHRPERVMAYLHSRQRWVGITPVRGVETHQRWDGVRHQDGRAEMSLADERALRRGDAATLVPPRTCVTMAMPPAPARAPTRSFS